MATIDLFEDNAGGLHIVCREAGTGYNGFERAQNRADYRATSRDEFTFASDAPDFDNLGEGSLYEPLSIENIESLYERAGETNQAVRVGTWEDGKITILTTNIGSAARWYLGVVEGDKHG